MKPNQPLTLKTNLKWLLSPESPTEAASPDLGEAEISPTEEMVEEATVENVVAVEGQEPSLPEGPGTHLTHQRRVVIAIIDMVRIRGTVWHLSHAHGKTNVQPEPEGQTNLENKEDRLVP